MPVASRNKILWERAPERNWNCRYFPALQGQVRNGTPVRINRVLGFRARVNGGKGPPDAAGRPFRFYFADLLLAPAAAAWAIGLLVGVNLLFFGFSLAMTAFAARNLAPR